MRLIDADKLPFEHYGEDVISWYATGWNDAINVIDRAPTVDAEPVRHGHWILEAHDERVNFRWNVTAMCSECCDEKNEIWAGFFPGVPDCIARDVALQDARKVKLSNYCPNCGAKMDGGKQDANV